MNKTALWRAVSPGRPGGYCETVELAFSDQGYTGDTAAQAAQEQAM